MANLNETLEIIQRGLASRLHIGVQLYVGLRGRVVADIAAGESRPGVAMTTDTLMPWLSAGKPVTAVAIARLWEKGKLDLDDPVASHIPQFAANGKASVTIRHILTHTGGFRDAAAPWSPLPWEQIIAGICASPLEAGWVPGQKAGYDAASGWFVLAEIVRRLDGRPYEQYVRDEIFRPLGMEDSWIGMPVDRFRAYGDRIGIMHDTTRGQVRPRPWEREEYLTVCRPGANARGPIRQLGWFYEMLLGRGQSPATGRRVLSPQSVEALTARHRTGMYDQTHRRVVDWALGFAVNSHMHGSGAHYGFGPYASPRAFGHGGSQSSMGLADPEHGLAVAFVFNGMPGEAAHAPRHAAMVAAIYADLGLASGG